MATFRDARVQTILAGRRATRKFPYPGEPDLEIAIRILTDQEADDAKYAAQSHVEKESKRRNIDPELAMLRDPELYDREHYRQILWRACFDPESQPGDLRPFFPAERDIRECDVATVSLLHGYYLDLLEAVDPRVTLTEERAKELIDDLGKGPNAAVLLAQYEPGTLRTLVRILAVRLATSPTGKSSTSPDS